MTGKRVVQFEFNLSKLQQQAEPEKRNDRTGGRLPGCDAIIVVSWGICRRGPEVVGYHDFIESGSFAKCKEKGHFRLEGKEYIVKDGDILHVRHG
jgi:ribosome-binding ATPase YchF (GTP1/OBG family)